MELTIWIDDKKSEAYRIKGIAIVDGFEIPFTAYRFASPPDTMYGQFDAISRSHVAVRSKSGILKKFEHKNFIRSKIVDASKGWWIDNNFWR